MHSQYILNANVASVIFKQTQVKIKHFVSIHGSKHVTGEVKQDFSQLNIVRYFFICSNVWFCNAEIERVKMACFVAFSV